MAQKLCDAINSAQRAREAKAREDTVQMAKKKEGLFWEKREQQERLLMKKEETRSRSAEVICVPTCDSIYECHMEQENGPYKYEKNVAHYLNLYITRVASFLVHCSFLSIFVYPLSFLPHRRNSSA
jgi:hypothetical protein